MADHDDERRRRLRSPRLRGTDFIQWVMVSFRVEDLDAATTDLESKGVAPSDEAVTDTGHKRFRSFHDPDGNMFQLIEITS